MTRPTDRAPSPRRVANRIAAALRRAAAEVDGLAARGLTVEALDAEGRREVDAFAEVLAGRVATLRAEVARLDAEAAAVLRARDELSAEARARRTMGAGGAA